MAASREKHISDLQNEQERGKNFYTERQPDQTTHKRGHADVSTARHIYSTPDEDYKRGSEHKGPLETESAKNLVVVPRTMLALIVIVAVLSLMVSTTVLVLFVTIWMPRNLSDASTQTTEVASVAPVAEKKIVVNTSEYVFVSDLKQELSDLKVDISALKGNVTVGLSRNEVQLSELKKTLAEIKQVIFALKENLTEGARGNNLQLPEVTGIKERIAALKQNQNRVLNKISEVKPLLTGIQDDTNSIKQKLSNGAGKNCNFFSLRVLFVMLSLFLYYFV